MADRALMMLEALDSLYPISKDHKDFIKRIINTAYHEGVYEGMKQMSNENTKRHEQDYTIRHQS